MAGWDDILKEMQSSDWSTDNVRRMYLRNLSNYTKRNTIAYYSAFLSRKDISNLDINDLDMTAFMNALKGMDCSKGLDLILHTPGGSPAAAEAIINYLRNKFSYNIRVVVPQLAMSAGTMMACAAKEIIMGKQSSLGPIDPQFNGIPAYNIKMEFEEAKKDLAKHPENIHYWAIKLQQYPAAFLKTAIDAIELSGKLVEDWLGTCMFDKNKNGDKKVIKNIVSNLNEHNNSRNHGRHLSMDFCKNLGLKIIAMEDDDVLQDAILSVHHSFMLTLGATKSIKIVETHEGKAVISQANN